MKARGVFGISTLFAILTALVTVTIYASSMRADVYHTAEKAAANTQKIEAVIINCAETQKTFQNALESEREDRKDEYTQIQIKLSEIDTHLIYIRKALEKGD